MSIRSEHVSVVIAASSGNLPRWAAGLARADVVRRGDLLVTQSPMGEVTVRFVPRNDLGVLDHRVTLSSGATVDNPLRVLAHPHGAEVVLTLRQGELTDEEFERDGRSHRQPCTQAEPCNVSVLGWPTARDVWRGPPLLRLHSCLRQPRPSPPPSVSRTGSGPVSSTWTGC